MNITPDTHICPCGNPVLVDGRFPTGFPFGPPEFKLGYHFACANKLGVELPAKFRTVTIPADLMDAYVALERAVETYFHPRACWGEIGYLPDYATPILTAHLALRKAQVTTKSADADSGLRKGTGL